MLGTNDLIEAYCSHKKRHDKMKPATETTYRVTLRRFEKWLEGRNVLAVKKADINLGYLPWWEKHSKGGRTEDGSFSAATVNKELVVLKSFYHYLVHEAELLDKNPVEGIELPKIEVKHNDWLSTEEQNDFLAAAATPQEKMIANLLRWSGLRCREACSLLNDDVVLQRSETYPHGYIEVRRATTKSRAGARRVLILPELRVAIEVWKTFQMVRGHRLGLPLHEAYMPFLATRSGKPMSNKQVWHSVKTTAKRAGIRIQAAQDKQGVNGTAVMPHTLRRTFGSDLINRGADLNLVRANLGHEHMSTTQRSYAKLLDERIAQGLLDAYKRPAA